jgi:hypothetical protein
MIEIFKTNITSKKAASRIAAELRDKIPDAKINFDLADRDRILRIDHGADIVEEVRGHLNDRGFICEWLG